MVMVMTEFELQHGMEVAMVVVMRTVTVKKLVDDRALHTALITVRRNGYDSGYCAAGTPILTASFGENNWTSKCASSVSFRTSIICDILCYFA